MKTLAQFISRNLGGRALFLSVPVAVAAMAHGIVHAATGQPFIAVFAGCIASLAAMAVSSWLWLDEEAAVALEKKYERGALAVCAVGLPFGLLSPELMAAMMVAGLASFGASCGIVRISTYADLPDPPPAVSRFAGLAWLCQTAALTAALASTMLLGDVIAIALSGLAVAVSYGLPRETQYAVVE